MADQYTPGMTKEEFADLLARRNAGAKKWVYQWHGSIERGSHIYIKPDSGYSIGDEIAYFPESANSHECASLLVRMHNDAIDAALRDHFWWFKRLRFCVSLRDWGFRRFSDHSGWGLTFGPFRLWQESR